MQIADEKRIKQRVIRILKANKDAFESFIATDENSQRRIFDSDEEIDYFVKETDLDFARAIARTRNHPLSSLFRVELPATNHSAPIEPFDGVLLKAVLVTDPNNAETNIEGLLINSSKLGDEAAKALVLAARANPDSFGGKDAIKECYAYCNNHLYLASEDVVSTTLIVTDVVRKDDNSLNSPSFCETGIIAGAVRRAMRGGLEIEVVKAHADFEEISLQGIKNGATILGDLPDF